MTRRWPRTFSDRITAPLPRPRDILEVKLEPAFHELHREIWMTLRDEVLKGYAQTGGG